MAGARPSQYKRGGNRIFTGDATILDYTIDDTFNGKPYDPKPDPVTKKSRFHWYYLHLTARFDGADAPAEKSFTIAGADYWATDGKTLVPNTEGESLLANGGWQILMDSLVAAGFDENLLSETEVNYEPIIGARVRFGSRKNERLAKAGKKQLNKKTGKSYDYEDIVVEQFYGFEAAKEAAKPAAAKTSGNGKANGQDLTALADATLAAILAEKGGSAKKSSLSLAVLQQLTQHPQRDDVRKKLGDDAFLAREQGWQYDKQTGVVTAN